MPEAANFWHGLVEFPSDVAWLASEHKCKEKIDRANGVFLNKNDLMVCILHVHVLGVKK